MRTCNVCGARFSATEENESRPVCMLRQAVAAESESSATCSADTMRPTPDHATRRFEHYDLVLDRNGRLLPTLFRDSMSAGLRPKSDRLG